jgi:hypothetical protein
LLGLIWMLTFGVISLSSSGTRDGRFLPVESRWVVGCLFVWLSHYRRLNTAFNHKPNFFVAHV